MSKNRYCPEEIIGKLREADIPIGQPEYLTFGRAIGLCEICMAGWIVFLETNPRSQQPPVDYAGYTLYIVGMTGKELIKLLRKYGWKIDRISGSLHVMVKGNKTLTVPVHGNKDLKKGTLEALSKQGGLK